MGSRWLDEFFNPSATVDIFLHVVLLLVPAYRASSSAVVALSPRAALSFILVLIARLLLNYKVVWFEFILLINLLTHKGVRVYLRSLGLLVSQVLYISTTVPQSIAQIRTHLPAELSRVGGTGAVGVERAATLISASLDHHLASYFEVHLRVLLPALNETGVTLVISDGVVPGCILISVSSGSSLINSKVVSASTRHYVGVGARI